MKVRKSLAAFALAAAAVATAAGCSSSNDTVSDATNKASAAVESASAAVQSAVGDATNAVVGLQTSDAQVIIRKAVDPATGMTDINTVVDTTNPATKAAIVAYAKGSNMAGYTPDVYTVKEVKANGTDKATVTVSVKSPHSPQPVDIPLTYVKVDGTWKLSGDAVTQLASMGGQHGG